MSEVKNIERGKNSPSREQKSPLINRPGLPRLSYRRTVYSDLYTRMADRLPGQDISDDGKTGTQPLSALSVALPDDPALAILDAWAVAGDVLTFYQERIANEGFLRTATERLSILNLSRSIGYELNPGLAATSHLAFHVDDAKGAPGVARIPAGTRVQSIPRQDELPQMFETMESIDARADWNQMRLLIEQEGVPQIITLGLTELFLEGIHTDISPGDVILLLDESRQEYGGSEVWEFRIINTAAGDMDTSTTRLTWSRGLGHTEGGKIVEPPTIPKAFVFRQKNKQSPYGHDAPVWRDQTEVNQSLFIQEEGLPIPEVQCVTISEDGSRAASATSTGTIKLWNVPNGTRKRTVQQPGLSVTCMVFMPASATTVIYGASDGLVRVYNLADNKLVVKLQSETGANGSNGSPPGITCLDVCEYPGSNGGYCVVAGNNSGGVVFWDITGLADNASEQDGIPPFHVIGGESDGSTTTAVAHIGAVTAIACSANGAQMATGGADHKVFLWGLVPDGGTTWGPGKTEGIKSTELTELSHTDNVTGVVYLQKDGEELLFSSSLSGIIKVWNTESDEAEAPLVDSILSNVIEAVQNLTAKLGELDQTIEAGVTCLARWDSDGEQGLLAGGLDKTIKQWQYDIDPYDSESMKWRVIRIYAGHRGSIVDVDSARGINRVVSAAADRLIKAWELSANVEKGVEIAGGKIIQYNNHVKTDVMSLGWHPLTDQYQNWPQLSITSDEPRIRLAGAVSQVRVNDWVVLAKPKYVELYRVTEVAAETRAGFSIESSQAGTVIEPVDTTILTVDTREHLSWFPPDKTDVYLNAREYILAEKSHPVLTPVQGPVFSLDRLVLGLESNQLLIVRGKRVKAGVSFQEESLSLKAVVGDDVIKLFPGDIVTLLEAPAEIEGGLIKWHVVDKFGFEGTVEGNPGDLYIIVSAEEEGPSKNGTSEDGDDVVSEICTILSVARSDPTVITITKPLSNIFDHMSVTIHGNVVEATHGETIIEVLGSGDGAASNQRFKLRKKGLTYIPAITPTGGESALEVRVNGILWEQVDELDGLSENDNKYIIRHDDEGFTAIIFGDGINGARLPTGVENVVATYRSGIGFAGNVGTGSLKLIQNKPLGVKSVTNFQAPYGSGEPESRDRARTAAPKTILTLDRVVSLKDYESFAMGVPGIEKAQAASFLMGEKWIVHLTVAGSQGETTAPGAGNYDGLIDTIKAFRDPMEEVLAESYQLRTFGVKMRILVDSRYETPTVDMAIRLALKETFSFENRNFSQDVTPSEVTSVIHSVEGVVAADIDDIYLVEMGQSEIPPIPVDKLTGERARLEMGIIKPAELLLIDPTDIHIGEMDIVETG